MTEPFSKILAIGGKTNSLGRAGDVVEMVLADGGRLEELYACLYEDDPWLRMRAADTLEKVCRQRPEWLTPYVNRLMDDFGADTQPSVQWHMAQLFAEVELSTAQRRRAIGIMTSYIRDTDVDWIVAANTMKTLALYLRQSHISAEELAPLVRMQLTHHSKSVVKKANDILNEINGTA